MHTYMYIHVHINMLIFVYSILSTRCFKWGNKTNILCFELNTEMMLLVTQINKHTGNLLCEFLIFIRYNQTRISLIFSFVHLRKSTTSNYLVCSKTILTNNQTSIRDDSSPSKGFESFKANYLGKLFLE